MLTILAVLVAGVALAGPAAAAVVPSAPRTVTATSGNGAANVRWIAPATNAAAVTGYSVTPSLAGVPLPSQSFASTALAQTVTGLTNGLSYTFTVTATSADGPSPASVASSPLLVGVPNAPSSPAAAAGDSAATVRWTAPADNGSPITGYVVTPYIGTVALAPVGFGATATSGIVTALTNGSSYTFKVAATNAVGTGVTSTTAATLIGTPAAPTAVVAVGGQGRATLSWTPGSDNGSTITGYTITPLVSNVAQPAQTFASAAATQTVVGLTDGVIYTFKVAATNTVGLGATTTSNTALVGPSAAPTAPTVTGGNGQATVKWTAPASTGSPIVGFVVTPILAGVPLPSIAYGAATTQLVTGLVNGGLYTFTVAAVNQGGTSAPSPASAPLLVGAPGAPTSVSALAGDTVASVKWTAPATNGLPIVGYTVTPYLGTVAQEPQTFASTAVTQVVSGLTNGSSYGFKVAALVAGGSGPLSATSAVVLVGTAAAPTSVVAAGGDARATVTWSPPVGGLPVIGNVVTPYIGAVAQPAQLFGPAPSAVVTGLTNGSTYTFRVAAVNAIGTSPTATSNSALVGPSGAPTAVSATSGDGAATVKWTAPSSVGSTITGYLVTPTLAGVDLAPVLVGATSPQVVTGLTNGSTYTFRVAAVNGAGPSAPSAPTNSVLVGAPAAPSGPSAIAGNGLASVRWTAAVPKGSPVTGYVVTPFVAGVPQAPQTFASTAVVQPVSGLVNGTSYTFTVAATIVGGTGPASAMTAAVIVGSPVAPASLGLTAGNGQATVTWVPQSGNGSAITGSVITPYIGTVAQPPRTFATNATSQVITGLANGTSYTFKVAAINANGIGAAATSSATVVGSPLAPTGLTVAMGPSEAQVTVRWNAPADNGSAISGSVVTPYLAGVAQTPRTFTDAATVQVISGLTVTKSYTFKVSAVNANGAGVTSAASPAVVAPALLPVTPRTISASRAHSCALAAGGTVRCWGANGDGQLGNATSVGSATPVTVVGITGAVAVSAGDHHTCALVDGGAVRCWGGNAQGQLGDGTSVASSTPVPVVGISGATSISAGGSHTCALVIGGQVRCWGYNLTGQLGNSTFIDSSTPVPVTAMTGATAITTGWTHSCAVVALGAVKCWGYNADGELGNGSANSVNAPVTTTGVTGAITVSAGGFHTCAVVANGAIKCWGQNAYGQLGNATTTGSRTAVDVVTTTGATTVELGLFHTCALVAAGAIKCWGDNGYGQLGTGTNTAASTPAAVVGVTGATGVGPGGGHTCAATAGGTRHCWGFNGFGQLGQAAPSLRTVTYDLANGCEGSPACNGGAGQLDLADAVATGPAAEIYATQESCSNHTEVATALGSGYRALTGWERTPADGGACGSAAASIGNVLYVDTSSGSSSWSETVRTYVATDSPGRRGFACAHTQVRNAPVLLCNTHLADDPAIAMAESTELLDWIAVNRGYWETVLVAGDFGLTPDQGGGAWAAAWTAAGFTSANSDHVGTRSDGQETDYVWVTSTVDAPASASLGQHSDHQALTATWTPGFLTSTYPVLVG